MISPPAPALGGIVGWDEAFPRDENAHHRVLFHYFDRFQADYEGRFEKEYGFLRPIPSKGWAEMIRKAYKVDPMVCP